MPSRSLKAPRALRPGDSIAVIAPSSPFDRDELARGIERLARRYDVRFDPAIHTRHGYLAGTDERRLRELTRAIEDPDVCAIVAARGGYGATRLLPALNPERVAEASKLLVGFSDVTALHALWRRAGLCSVHGAMVTALGRGDEGRLARWCSMLEGAKPEPFELLESVVGGDAEGVLAGGNLAVLTAMLGTPYMPSLDGTLLFLEDTGERPYRIDRMLTTLLQSGALSGVAGIVLGLFTESSPGVDGTTVEAVLEERLGTLGIPVWAGLPIGHIDHTHELPLGARARVGGGRLELMESAVSLC